MFSFLVSLPLILFAQNKIEQKKLPFIESITSDTLKSNYEQIIFTYDQNNRVTNIIKTKCKTKKLSPNDPFPLIDTIEIQQFNYTKKNINPISRKITQFEYDPVDQQSLWKNIEIQVFLYKDGKHIQDSIIYKENRLHLDEDNIDNDKAINWKGTYKYSSRSIKYILDRNYLKIRDGGSPYGETTELLINGQQNIEKEAEEAFFKPHSASNPPYFTFTKFDNAFNPFRYLNIAGVIPNDKISFSFNANGLISNVDDDEDISSLGNTDFNWYYLNQNNIINYTITRGETDSPFQDIIQQSYIYNQLNLPVQCFTEIRKEFKNDGRLIDKYQKHFTFRYRN